jgi:hypothetical protein
MGDTTKVGSVGDMVGHFFLLWPDSLQLEQGIFVGGLTSVS